MNQKHISPTPWQTCEDGTAIMDNNHITIMCDPEVGTPKSEIKANAKLASLAPELAEQLKDLVYAVEAKNNGDYSGDVRVSKAVELLKQLGMYEEANG